MTDYFVGYKSLFSTTLSTGIGTGTGETITPASVSGLPTDKEVTLTINRVDSGGTVLATAGMERIRGTISGGNLINYTRGVDSTTDQAHSAGEVIEMVFNAADWNNAVTGILVEHNQTGVHKGPFITASHFSASSINASAINASAVSAGRLAASAVVSGNLAASSVLATNLAASAVVSGNLAASSVVLGNLSASSVSSGNLNFSVGGVSAKMIFATRAMDAATGDVSYTGVGFTPKAIFAHYAVSTTLAGGSGATTGATANTHVSTYSAGVWGIPGDLVTSFIALYEAIDKDQSAKLKTFDADGFTLTWTRTGATNAGTARLGFLCIG